MCGIFAAVDLENVFTSQDLNQLNASLRMVSYRGPDGTGFGAYEGASGRVNHEQFSVYLGHNRLSIIDLSEAGLQPFTNDGKVFISFNGEIYNYLELREDLRQKGYQFETQTDTEVILNLYKQSGTARFGEMNGMWAFVLYDAPKRRLVVSRDRFGVKPLYYAQEGNRLYFGSEIKQLLPFLPQRKVNQSILANYLYDYLIDHQPTETFFTEVKKLAPKHSMVIDLHTKRIHKEQYWDFRQEDLSVYTEEELYEQFYALLTDAVRLRLRSDVKVGNTLSGGLDSSSIALIANKLVTGGLKNYSVVSQDKQASEEPFVDLLAAYYHVDVTKLRFNPKLALQDLEKVIWHHDEPILSLSTVAHFQMMRLFKEQTDITVILSGQGGDEGLAGYNKYFFFNLKELLRLKHYVRLMKESVLTMPKLMGEFRWNYAKRYLPIKTTSFAEQVTTLSKQSLNLTGFDDFRSRQILDVERFSVPALTHYEDRTSMASSLEIRLPFLDYRLMNFNVNLPLSYKIKDGYTKYILRKSLKELPPEIAWRKDKKGFTLQEDGLLSAEFLPQMSTYFDKPILAEMGWLDVPKFKQELANFLSGKTKYWFRDIHRVIFAEIWAKQFLV